MFGPKKPRVSKDQLKKTVVSANKKLTSANDKLKKDIESGKEKLESIIAEHSAYTKAVEDTKEMQVFANNELDAIQLDISEAQVSKKEALSKVASLSEEAISLGESNEKLETKSVQLNKSIEALEEKEAELVSFTGSLKQIKKEEADGQETLELLAIELNDLETGVESYISRKSAAESEFNTFTAKIEREKDIARKGLESIKEDMVEANFASGKEMGRLDKAIAERIAELQEMDANLHKKVYELSAVQSRIGSVEERVRDAEERIEHAIKKEQDKVSKIKIDFKDWKIQALDEVARLKLKKKIENIDRAGLKDVLDG